MTQGGAQFCNEAEIRAAVGAGGVVTEANVWYYDGAHVYQQIADYTGNPFWLTCASYSNRAYREWVLATTNGVSWPVGALNGWRIFPDGLLSDYRRTGSADSRTALLRMSLYSPYAQSAGEAACQVARETAYIIRTYVATARMGEPRTPLLATAVDYAIGHINQWFVHNSCPELYPFVVGLTLEALIDYYELTGDSRIPHYVQVACDGLWTKAWVPGFHSFYYSWPNETNIGAPDANLLIASAYAWAWQRSGFRRNGIRGDQVFAGGVQYATYWSGKQFSQNYRWSFDYVKWRSAKPGSLPLVIP